MRLTALLWLLLALLAPYAAPASAAGGERPLAALAGEKPVLRAEAPRPLEEPDQVPAGPSPAPVAQATPVPGPIQDVTQPTPAPRAVAAPADPWSIRVQSFSSLEFSSNVTQRPGGLSDSVLKLPVSATVGYRLPGGGQALLGYQYQAWRYSNVKENDLSLHLGTLVLSQPITGFASVYGGYQMIYKVSDTGSGTARLDHDLLAGLSLYAPLGDDKVIYGGYQFDSVIAEVNATSFNGHSLNLGYKQALTPALVLSGRYRFQHRQPQQARVVASNLHTLGAELEYRFLPWLGASVRADYIVNSFAGASANDFSYFTGGIGLSLGVDNRVFGKGRPVAQVPAAEPTAAPTPVAEPSPEPTPSPAARATPVPVEEAPADPPGSRITVPRGTTLRQLAEWYYGDERLWPYIARANRLENPDLIRSGQHLVVPSQRFLGIRTRTPVRLRPAAPPAWRPAPSRAPKRQAVHPRAPERQAVRPRFVGVPGLSLVRPPTVVPVQLQVRLIRLSQPAYLQELARIYYGDPGQWRVIARANGIRDPERDKVSRRMLIPALPAR